MKVAITSQGPDLNSPLDPRFGRAKYLLVVDLETNELVVHDNAQNASALQGAGIQAARAVADLGASAVITGHVGPKAFVTLDAAGIAVYTDVHGTVADAVARLKSAQLALTEKANVEGHW
jgi:predicted Fe-Mo cluster-binding NifX family protein